MLALAIALDVTPWVRGGYGWRWPYAPVDFARVVPLIIVMVIYLAVSFALLRYTKRALPLLLWSVLGTVTLSFAVAHARDPQGDALYALFTRTASALTTGPHWAATQVDWQGGEWRNWTDVMARLGGHLATSPPGLPMGYALLNHELDALPGVSKSLQSPLFPYQCHNYTMLDYTPGQWASAWFGILMPLWAGLTVFPLYGITRQVGNGDPRIVAVWWALVPGILAFAASWSTFYPLVSAAVVWLLVQGMVGGTPYGRTRGTHAGVPLKTYKRWDDILRYGWLFAAGVVSGIALFLNFAFLPLLGLCGFFVLFSLWRSHRVGTQRAASRPLIGVIFGGGVVLPWLLYWLAGGNSFFAILKASLDYHLDLDRPYWFWVGMHLWDWALWSGVGLALLWLVGVFQNWRSHETSAPNAGEGLRSSPAGTALAASLLLTVLMMTLSGTTQGESGRIWLFLSPFVLICAWEGLHRIGKGAWRAVFLITAAHAVLAIVLTANLAVIGTDFTRPPQVPPLVTLPVSPINANFAATEQGDVFRLIAWRSDVQNDAVRLTLHWLPLQPMREAYWFGAFLIAPDGTTTQPVLWQPNDINGKEARYPTACWQPGVALGDQTLLPLPADRAPGDWWVSLAVFGDEHAPEGRLQVTQAGDVPDVQVGLGPVVVVEP